MASLSGGGAEHQLTFLANFLAEKGNDVSVVTFTDIQDHYIVDDSVSRIRIAEGKGNKIKLLTLWYFLLKVRTDGIIIFTQRNSCLALPPLFFRRNVTVICGERNLTTGTPTTYEKILCSCLYKRANFIVSNSHSQENYLRSTYSSLANKCRTIINYTDLDKFTPVRASECSRRRIGVFARIDEQKNCVNFAKAVKKATRNTTIPFQIVWYGNKYNGTQLSSEYERLQEFITKSELQEIFIVKDPVKDPSAVMKELDIICLPSLYEGFSNSIAEAICAGKPMIVSDVSDNSIMVKDNVNGFLFDPSQIDDMNQKITSILEKSDDDLYEMGMKSRAIAEELFEKETFINSYISLLSKG